MPWYIQLALTGMAHNLQANYYDLVGYDLGSGLVSTNSQEYASHNSVAADTW